MFTIFVILFCRDTFSANLDVHKIKHVIYLTLDGTRWQDVLLTRENFPKLWQAHAVKMKIYGLPDNKSVMEVASIPVSLPSYQSQMTGAVQACQDNQCGQVKTQTLPEFLLSKLELPRQNVAVFSSWPVIADALESKKGTIFSNVGNIAVVDPLTGVPDEQMAKINYMQTLKRHIESNRLDAYTFEQSMHYFEKYRPTFMWISLVNADNEAHMDHPAKYHEMLLSYDRYIDELITKLKKMQLDHSTMLIITTDHGRGDGLNWTTHGSKFPESKKTWAMVMNGKLKPIRVDNGVAHYNTLSIRPTIEEALS